jgi:dephospho-CoA kinase
MIKAGITGGIGTGKTLICQVFSALHVPVYYADEEAKRLTDDDSFIRDALIRIFGEKLYETGKINRVYMAEKIFHDKGLLEKVTAVIHPRVAGHFAEWCHKQADKPYIIQESAILFESNAYRNFDRIITVHAPEDLRIQRVLKRPNMSLEKIRAIMQNQLAEEEKIKRADFIIYNDELTLLMPQILQIHGTLTANN